MADLLDQMRQTPPKEPVKEVVKPQIDVNQLDEMFSKKLDAYDKAKQQKQNFDTVQSKMKQQWGSNYTTTLQEQMDQLGLTREDVNELAQNRPALLIKTLGLNEQKAPSNNLFQSPPPNQMRSDNFLPAGANKRTWKYYQELRKKDPMAFYDPKISVQMQKDRLEQGEAFEDGDYNREDLDRPWG